MLKADAAVEIKTNAIWGRKLTLADLAPAMEQALTAAKTEQWIFKPWGKYLAFRIAKEGKGLMATTPGSGVLQDDLSEKVSILGLDVELAWDTMLYPARGYLLGGAAPPGSYERNLKSHMKEKYRGHLSVIEEPIFAYRCLRSDPVG